MGEGDAKGKSGSLHDPDLAVAETLEFAGEGALDTELQGSSQPSASPSSRSKLERGAVINRYLLLEQIGSGGMGVVYRAYDPELERRIALKFIRVDPDSQIDMEDARARLIREAQALARLNHPNVVSVYDVGTEGHDVFLAMEFISGISLRQWAARKGRDMGEILRVYIEAARGLAAAHDAGMVHRDFKPENVMVGKDGRVRVLDFGLVGANPNFSSAIDQSAEELMSLAVDSGIDTPLTLAGAKMGTPQFMAPEQHKRQAVDARADQFSFCVALYQALYRERPFKGATYGELAEAVMAGELSDAPKDSKVPGWLRSALVKGMSVSPEDRFASMTELIEALQADPSLRRKRLWTRVGLVLAGAAGAMGLWWSAGRASTDDSCGRVDEEMAGVWDRAIKEQVRMRFEATKLPYAADTFDKISRRLDTHTQEWLYMRQERCEARAKGSAESVNVAVQMDCLDRRKSEIAALTSLLASEGEPEFVSKAVVAVDSLPGIFVCGDLEILKREVTPPSDPAMRADVRAAQDKLERAQVMEKLGRLEQAKEAILEVRRDARLMEYQPLRAQVLLSLSSVEMTMGNAAEAAKRLYEAIEVASRAQMDILLAEAWTDLVWIESSLGHSEKAVNFATVAQAAIRRIASPVVLNVRLESFWGSALEALGRYDEATPHLERALALAKEHLPPDDVELGALLTTLGSHYRNIGNYELAREHQLDSLRIHEMRLGPEHPDVATSLVNIALLLQEGAEIEEAQRYLKRALAIYETSLDPEHPHIAQTLNNLGITYANQGRHREAVEVYRRSIAIFEQRLGADHQLAANTLNSLGLSLRSLELFDESRQAHERALEVIENNVGKDSVAYAVTLTSLGLLAADLGKLEEADQLHSESLAIYEKVLGPSHYRVAVALSNLGEVASRLGRYDRALVYCERALVIDRQSLGDEHPDLAFDLACIGDAHLAAKDYDEALEVFERAYDLRSASEVPPSTLGDSCFDLAKALWTAGRDRARALRLAEEAKAAYEAGDAAENAAEVASWLQTR